MDDKGWGLSHQNLSYPECIIEITPGLPAGTCEPVTRQTPAVCDKSIRVLQDTKFLERWVLLPVPRRFPSDGSWWVDLDWLSLVVVRIILTANRAHMANCSLRVGLVTPEDAIFRDAQGLWTANSEGVPFPVGATEEWYELCATEKDWVTRVKDRLGAPGNLLCPYDAGIALPLQEDSQCATKMRRYRHGGN